MLWHTCRTIKPSRSFNCIWCEWLVGVVQARREVSELVSSMVEAGGGLPLPEDRLLTIMEAAQVVLPPTSHTYGGVLPGVRGSLCRCCLHSGNLLCHQ